MTGMSRMTGSIGITTCRMTGMIGETRLTRMTGMTGTNYWGGWVTGMTGVTLVTCDLGVLANSLEKKEFFPFLLSELQNLPLDEG